MKPLTNKRLEFFSVKTNNYVEISLVMRNTLYAFDITAMALIEQLSECLVHVLDWAIVRKLNFLADKRSFEGKW